jgi:hypothetical protein
VHDELEPFVPARNATNATVRNAATATATATTIATATAADISTAAAVVTFGCVPYAAQPRVTPAPAMDGACACRSVADGNGSGKTTVAAVVATCTVISK